ncbi:MAG TPA: hypothetical protein VN622_05785 [Clostridia bacterium]|nr:hypothetical protein [Clostridia bacterium]
MMASSENLYTAKQAAAICGISDTALQIALDREHVRAAVVTQGARTYRLFSREHLISLWIFARMAENGLKPSAATVYIENLENELAAEPVLPGGLKHVFCHQGLIDLVGKDQQADDTLRTGAYVVDYEGTCAAIDDAINTLPILTYWLNKQGHE